MASQDLRCVADLSDRTDRPVRSLGEQRIVTNRRISKNMATNVDASQDFEPNLELGIKQSFRFRTAYGKLLPLNASLDLTLIIGSKNAS